MNPFEQKTFEGRVVQAIDADSRVRMVKRMDVAALEQVLVLPGVQKTVLLAAQRRLRALSAVKKG